MSDHKEDEHKEETEGEVNSDAIEAAFSEHEFGGEEEEDPHHHKPHPIEEDDPSPEWHSMDDQDSW